MSVSRTCILVCCCTVIVFLASREVSVFAEPPVALKIDFNRQILPILSDHCYACHGPDEKTRKADLRLDTKEGLFNKLESDDFVVKPGKPEESLLIERINSSERDKIMPPGKHNKPLKPEQKKMLEEWIRQGANWSRHWSFAAPGRTTLPAVKQTGWVKNPIDAFILAKLQEQGLTTSPPASKAQLLRRVTLDLTGLPPTSSELDAFLADNSPKAYEKVVDRLLSSQRYAEHQARQWLDVARYGDTHGLHLDNYREAWPYREWVIKSFLRNQPYDQFITEQLAGDLLPNATLEQTIATGYNRCHVTTSEGGSIDEEVYVRNVVDQVDTFGTVFLGLTVGCARCHDHKYDPLSTKEYYQLFAFFNNIDGAPLDGNAARHAPIAKVGTPEELARLDELQKKIDLQKHKVKDELARIKYVDPLEGKPSVELATREKRADFVWIDDDIPVGSESSYNSSWQFVSSPSAPVYSGRVAHTRTATGLSQHLIQGAKQGLVVGNGDSLFAYVYIDPKNPTKEIMLQWNTGDWKHRAYWGDNKIDWGADKTGSRMLMGPLPEAGRWVRLSVPVDKVGLKPGDLITGWAFTQFDGTVTWDRAGINSRTPQGVTNFDSLISWLHYEQSLGGAKLPGPLQKVIKIAPDKRNDAQQTELREYFLENINPATKNRFATLQKEVEAATKERADFDASIPATLISKERKEPRPAFILKRGEYDQRGDKVERGTPVMFPPMKSDVRKDRLGLAQWLLDPNHPTTSRVAVNRFWQQVFGTGLAKTAEDLGLQGEPPTHLELLDWLAVEFRESGWDVKNLMKLMVMSNTYQQSAKMTPDRLAKDPGNRYYSRGPRHRLDAEVLRDQALYVSGLLVEKLGGPSVKPPQPSGLWEAVGYVSSNTANFKADTGVEKVHRRSLYTFWKRTAPPPQMSAMDAPSRESCTVRRERTNTPLQALLLLNETQYVECARSLAQRSMTASDTIDGRIKFLIKSVLCRDADAQELTVLKNAYQEQLSYYTKSPAEADKLLAVGESKPNEKLNKPELAALTMVANIVLNLDEALTK
ncbi:MAG TPA: PSD1 and planctomycete cytochrome C domain-containing protein [Gemmatales bacterium]|nr:PSD1 and planctomycete cytochrome C domain-containing protein [Gemmatales bacterium]